jgi:hypothetical protein
MVVLCFRRCHGVVDDSCNFLHARRCPPAVVCWRFSSPFSGDGGGIAASFWFYLCMCLCLCVRVLCILCNTYAISSQKKNMAMGEDYVNRVIIRS